MVLYIIVNKFKHKAIMSVNWSYVAAILPWSESIKMTQPHRTNIQILEKLEV